MKIAMPGAGRPRKVVVCVSSMLNLAKRMAAKIGSRKAKHGNTSTLKRTNEGRSAARSINQHMINPGATPKETTSESESKSAPIGECALRRRAVNPSKKSKRPATRIMTAALMGMFSVRNKIDRQPDTRLPQVRRLGRWCLMFILSLFSIAQRYCFFGKAVSLQEI